MTVFEYVHATASSKMPRPSAATTVRGMLSIRPITAAASVRSRSALPDPGHRREGREPDDRHAQQRRERRQERGDRPHGEMQVVDRDAEEVRPVRRSPRPRGSRCRSRCTGGTRPSPTITTGTTIIASTWSPRNSTGKTVKCIVERRLERAAGRLPSKSSEMTIDIPGEDLRDADRGDGQDQPRRLPEPPDDEDVDDRADERRPDQSDRRATGSSSSANWIDELDRDDRRDAAELGLREVHDAVRAEDQDEPDGRQRVEGAEDGAEDDDAEREARGRGRCRG